MSNLIKMLEEIRGINRGTAEVCAQPHPEMTNSCILDKRLQSLIDEERAVIAKTSGIAIGDTYKTANGRPARIICNTAKIDKGNNDIVALITETDGSDFIEWYSSKDAPSGMLRGSGENLDLIL